MSVAFRCAPEDIQAAGLECSEQEPCPVYLELTVVGSAGRNLFVGGNLHSQAVTLATELLGSRDGGHTWQERHPPIRFGTLDRIQFVDDQAGWISGELFSPLPQDPFLLVTTDGGETWRQRPVFAEDAEDHAGSVQQFWFADRNNGELIIDRGEGSDQDEYERYESRTGGENWSMRESSAKPLRLRDAGEPSGQWRLVADRTTQAFQVQRRRGEGWETLGAFLVNAGTCKP